MRIALLAPPYLSIPPRKYGGTELVIHNLAEELVRRGHEVTLFASGDSRTAARLVPTVERALWERGIFEDAPRYRSRAIARCYAMDGEFDLIHNHLDSAAYPAARASATPTVTTLHGRLDLPGLPRLYHNFRDMALISISNAQRAPLLDAGWLATVYNGIDVAAFPAEGGRGGYLAFLGRLSPEKGVHTAVEVARRAGMRLKVAARLPLEDKADPWSMEDRRYFEEVLRPLFRGPDIEFLGEADHALKGALLGGAAALLFPIAWPEPFGLVMAEAMACGTPVIATRRGSVPEVVADGETGFVGDSVEDLVAAVGRLGEIDRGACRRRAAERFSVRAMADAYESAYRAALGQPRAERVA
jgi:glycosyltransferase involved in cell wall biosynthesis